MCKKKTIKLKNVNIAFNTLRIYITLYHVEKKTKSKQNINNKSNLIQQNIDLVTFLYIYHLCTYEYGYN